MSNVLTLRNQARKKSGVNSTDYSNADVLTDLNQAYYTLAGYLANMGETYFEEQNDKFDLVQNSALYSLPTDCIAVRQVRLAYTAPTGPSDYRIATSYDPTAVHNVAVDEENIPTSNPIINITNNYVRIKPTPTSNVTAGGKIFYIAMPSALVNTGDTPVFPIQYQDLMSIYAAMEMTFKYEKWKKYKELSTIWNTKIGEMQQVLADRDSNKPVRFESPLEAMVSARGQQPREL